MLVRTCSFLRRVSCLFVLWSSLGVCTTASADDSWHAPAGCPDRSHAEARLRALHVDPALLDDAHASVWFDLSATGEQRARVRLRHGQRVEQRVLYDRSCAALAEAALVVISLAFEDEHAEPTPRLTTSDTTKPARPYGVALAPLARLDVGSLPSVTFGFGGALRLTVGRVAAELEGSYLLPRDEVRDGGRVRGTFGLAAGAARACYGLLDGWLSACTSLELGRARGEGVNLSRSQEARGFWAAVLLGLAVRVPTPHVSPIALLELGLPFRRPSFDVVQAGPLFQTASAILRVSLQVSIDVRSPR